MTQAITNRDLYVQVTALGRRHRGSELTLEHYLANLRRLASAYHGRPTVTAAELLGLLRDAFEREPSDAAPPTSADTCVVDLSDRALAEEAHAKWRERIDAQILDLQQMRASGQLDDEYLYFGVDAPSGARWYNFDPTGFLECAMAGTFGGWEEGDDTGRDYVPGLVTVIDESGATRSVDPRELDRPPSPLPPLTWEQLTELLWAGQCYE